MYDYEYEWEVLGFLRMLKYAWQMNQAVLTELSHFLGNQMDINTIYEEAAPLLLVEYLCTDYLEDEAEDPYDGELPCYGLSEPDLNEFLKLCEQIDTIYFGTWYSVGERKLRDAAELFVVGGANTVVDFKLTRRSGVCSLIFWLSPDCYQPIEFGNSIIDLITYIRAENTRMREELAALDVQQTEVAA